MKLVLSDLGLMRWSLLTIGLSALFSAAFLYGSNEYATHILQTKTIAQGKLDNARRQLTSAYDDRENMAAYADEYALLEAGGIIGDDHRLDWIEGLENLRQKNLVTAFRYNISPQIRYAPAQPINSGEFDIGYSGMKLEFELLHEGQLLNFFTALRTHVKGRYQLEGCTLQRVLANEQTDARLKAECHGGWITMKNRNPIP